MSDAAIIQNIQGLVDGIANAYHQNPLSDHESEDPSRFSVEQGPTPEDDGASGAGSSSDESNIHHIIIHELAPHVHVHE